VAWDQRPDRRTRRALLHLSYSSAPPFGPVMLVTQGPAPTSGSVLFLVAMEHYPAQLGSLINVAQRIISVVGVLVFCHSIDIVG